jgi:hypothetical protein
MSQSYSVIFSSRGSNVVSNSNLNAVQYYCNWPAMLPIHKYKRYSCVFIFKSETYTGLLTNNGFVNMNIGKTDIFDGTSQSFNLGIIYPVALGSTSSFYNSTNNDNNQIVLYPNENMVTIKLNTFAGTAMANMQNYVLILNITPIEDKNEIKI